MNVLGIFAKHWTPGQVKTRLAATVGNEAAARFHYECVHVLVRRFARLGDRRVLAFAPAEKRSEFEAFAERGWETIPQAEGDLGARMRQFFEDQFRQGAERVVLIGSDSPTLPSEHLVQAFELLAESPIVLGPAEDGGYYLIGLREAIPSIFEGIAWGSDQVLRQTLEILQHLEKPFQLLPHWHDVDEFADLVRLRTELAALAAADSLWQPLSDAAEECLR